jgi:protein-S-isoprenylcysteine O-methyltransferase Ste14
MSERLAWILIRTAVFTVVVPGTVVVLLPWLVLPREPELPWLDTRWGQAIGFALFLTGAGIYLKCAWDFAVRGRGTPAPIDPPKRLVADGLYRWSRNPIYVGAVTAILGGAVAAASLPHVIYAAIVAGAFHLFVVFVEEPALRKQFSEEYGAYCRRVPRWLPAPWHRPPPSEP